MVSSLPIILIDFSKNEFVGLQIIVVRRTEHMKFYPNIATGIYVVDIAFA